MTTSHPVYVYNQAEYGNRYLFSDGVKREFGQNREICFSNGDTLFACVMPLKVDPKESPELKELGFIVNGQTISV